jgi:hypothetical protein
VNIIIHVVLVYTIMLFLFTGVSYKQDLYFAHAITNMTDCIEEMRENPTLDCGNADTLNTTTDSFNTTADTLNTTTDSFNTTEELEEELEELERDITRQQP